MKQQILVYGSGSKAIEHLPALAMQYNITGFLDSSAEKSGSTFLSLPVYHYSQITELNFDLIVIASGFSKEIMKCLSPLTDKYVDIEQLTEITEIKKELLAIQSRYRAQSLSSIPLTPLGKEHLAGATLITNRAELMRLVASNGIGAELGVANGDFTSIILSENKPQKLHLVDVWMTERYNDTLYENVRNKFSNEIANEQVEIHRKLSVEASFDFPDGYFDWVYIDTNHCYPITKAELEHYAAKVKPGGLLMGHDYTMGNWVSQFRYGVMEAVHEFCVKENWKIKFITMDLYEGQSFVIEKIV